MIGVSCGDYRRNGAFAEFIAVPERILYRLPQKMSFPEAAMLEATSVALHAVKVSGVKKGDTTLVVGAGMIGLLTMQALRAAGVGRVMIADIDETRLTLGELLGADEALRGTGGEIAQAILQRTVVLAPMRCSMRWGAQRPCGIDRQRAQRRDGDADRQHHAGGYAAAAEGGVAADPAAGNAASSGEYPASHSNCISTGRIHVRPLITAVAPLEEGPEWFERLHAQEPNLMKVVLLRGEAEGMQAAA